MLYGRLNKIQQGTDQMAADIQMHANRFCIYTFDMHPLEKEAPPVHHTQYIQILSYLSFLTETQETDKNLGEFQYKFNFSISSGRDGLLTLVVNLLLQSKA